jgi:hypothetical protein
MQQFAHRTGSITPDDSAFAYLLTLVLPFVVTGLVLGFFFVGRKLARSQGAA